MGIQEKLISVYKFNEPSGSPVYADLFGNNDLFFPIELSKTPNNDIAAPGQVKGYKNNDLAVDFSICNKYLWDSDKNKIRFRTLISIHGARTYNDTYKSNTYPYLYPFFALRSQMPKTFKFTDKQSFTVACWLRVNPNNWINGKIKSGEYAHSEVNSICGRWSFVFDNSSTLYKDGREWNFYIPHISSGNIKFLANGKTDPPTVDTNNSERWGIYFTVAGTGLSIDGTKRFFTAKVADSRFLYPKSSTPITRPSISPNLVPGHSGFWPTGEWIFAVAKYDHTTRKAYITASTIRDGYLRPFVNYRHGSQPIADGAITFHGVNLHQNASTTTSPYTWFRVGGLGYHSSDNGNFDVPSSIVPSGRDWKFSCLPSNLQISELWIWNRAISYEEASWLYTQSITQSDFVRNQKNINLFMNGCSGVWCLYKSIPLTLFAGPSGGLSKSLNLILGSGNADNRFASSIPLYLHSLPSSTGMISLTIFGGIENKSLPIYIHVDDYKPYNANIPLYIPYVTSAGITGMFNNLNVVLSGNVVQPANNLVPIFLLGRLKEGVSGQLDVYIHSPISTIHQSIPIFTNNLFASGQITLYQKGRRFDGYEGDTTISDGAIPIKNNINIFVNKKEGIAVLPLFCKTVLGSGEAWLNLSTLGTYNSVSGINVVLPQVKKIIQNNIGIHERGF